MSDRIELLPCPFCGINPFAYEAIDLIDRYVHWTTIKCAQCGVEVSEEYTSQATAAWNTRAPLPFARGEQGNV